jgi:hypothetical protein
MIAFYAFTEIQLYVTIYQFILKLECPSMRPFVSVFRILSAKEKADHYQMDNDRLLFKILK